MDKTDAPAFPGQRHDKGLAGRFAANIRFINLHQALQTIARLTHYGQANAVRPGPGRLARPEPENTLQVCRRDPVTMNANLPDRTEPEFERLARAVK